MRVRIPKNIEFRVLYKSARTCVVCRISQKAIQIHHIDKDHSNNSEENLAVVCADCHQEAHTHREMAKNLTPDELVRNKKEWERIVSERSSEAMTSYAVNREALFPQANWTFINHNILPMLMKKFDLGSKPSQGIEIALRM